MKRNGQREQIVSFWAVGMSEIYSMFAVTENAFILLSFYKEPLPFTPPSLKVTLFSLIHLSSFFSIKSSGVRQMTKTNKHNKVEYPNWPEKK